LKDDLSQLRQGGRFNPQVLENLRVQLKQGGAVKLGDLAQVVPKGRIVQVVVGEQEVWISSSHLQQKGGPSRHKKESKTNNKPTSTLNQ